MMIITFKSPADADIIMFADNAQALLEIMGKDKSPKGIITVEQLPSALQCLSQAMETEPIQENTDIHEQDSYEDNVHKAAKNISLKQRAWPLRDMLEKSIKTQKPIIWETS